MSTIAKFDDLPNELIIRLFDYLEPTESFQSFFDCNDRLRGLVKRYVHYNRRALDKDIQRFSTLHSWYKHLHFIDGGVTFYMVPLKGEQERYNFDSWVSDPLGIHWHFWRNASMPLDDERIEEISRKYPIKLTPLFHPHASTHELVAMKNPDFVREYYPEQFQRFETTLFQKPFDSASGFNRDDAKLLMEYIEKEEPKRLRNNIQRAANAIWKEIQALEDVNILEIKYTQQTAGTVKLVVFKKK